MSAQVSYADYVWWLIPEKLGGNRRRGMLLAAYLVTQGQNPEQAIVLVQKARPTA